ncbi:N-acetylmuramoyl-L-alanine amidase [Cognatilysobacter terrigena]|uniref:N-acetylmuramoyl-L-alanine amidase n=1 Tax=Cognatilysobacter terrigena TaxID=2488749 RepID=UPI0010603B93|nr:N-acetylmuramoyl-L-alanine amidase [Lysobacter terrigena]
MRVKVDTVQKVLLGAALIAALAWNLAQAAEVRSVHLSRGATGTRAEIALDGAQADYRLIRLGGPDRLVVDLPASSVRRGASLPAPAGIVRSVRYGQPEPGVARVVFDLAQPIAALQPQVEPSGNGSRLVIEWPGDEEGTGPTVAATTPVVTATPSTGTLVPMEQPVAAPPSSAASTGAMDRLVTTVAATPAATTAGATATTAPVRVDPPVTAPIATAPAYVPPPIVLTPAKPTLRDASGRPLRPLVIAIDAGHGGQDPGAHGPTGRREKDVTLAIARELARQVNATPGYKAYLTRDSDFFIPLNERARLAKRAGADMFVSIHADAAENPAARGSSVFVLSLKGASSQRARWLADKENSADLIGGVPVEPGNTLASVLLDLTQSGNLKASEDVAGQVLSGLARLGPNHKSSVERANFAVLRTSDTPAMLVETAFISNPDEEQRLTDPTQQAAIARAVFGGINSYFVRTPPPGTMLAAQVASPTYAGSAPSGGGR